MLKLSYSLEGDQGGVCTINNQDDFLNFCNSNCDTIRVELAESKESEGENNKNIGENKGEKVGNNNKAFLTLKFFYKKKIYFFFFFP